MNRRQLLLLLGTAAAFPAAMGCDKSKSGGENGANPSTTTSAGATAGSAGGTGAVAMSSAAAAFNKPRKPTGPVLVKVITNGNSPFWDSMGKGLADEITALQLSPQSGWTAPPGTDNDSQKTAFEQAMAANADGIAVSTIDAAAFSAVINSGIAKGIPVITFDSDSPTSERLVYIGTNNYASGKLLGQQVVKLLPQGGNMVAFVGNMSADNAKQRYNGFLDSINGHNITMLQDPYEDNADIVGKAHSNVADAITKYGSKINGFLGLYSYNGPAIVDEVKKAGLIGKVKICCFDGEPRTLDNLLAGLVDVTVVQKPYQFGRLSAEMLYQINRVGLDAALKLIDPELKKLGMTRNGPIIDTGVQVITPANAKPFIQDLHAKGLTST
ncbi:MAG: substrate-binding domain-containing protein [Armatimonadetes bacterium]|nr:substrate-binding domain-containing protein [Armatimonadota bacterium]MDE2207710.1 substrate-binding domain-containing protein [Armatimonadota bacterium]